MMKSKKRKQQYRNVFILGVCMLALAGCKGKSSNAVAEIQASGALKVAIRTEGNPYIAFEGETAVGEEAELANQIAAALGVQPEFLSVDTVEEAKELVSTQQADIAMGMISSQTDVGDSLTSSNFYEEGRLYVLTRRGDYSDSPAAFQDRVLGVSAQVDDSSLGIFQDKATMYTYQTGEEAVQALLDSVLDGYICYLEDGLSYLSDERVQLQNIKGVDSEQYVILTESADTTLLQGINVIIGQYLDSKGEETESETETATE